MDQPKRSTTLRAAHHIVAGVLAATAAIAAPPADAAADMFLKLDGIKGESKDGKHPGEIDLIAWSWGAAKGSTGQRGANPTQVCGQHLSTTKFVDSATAGILRNLTLGGTIPKARLTVRRSGQNPLEYMVIELENVQVGSQSTHANSGSEDRVVEVVTFAFSAGTLTYTEEADDGTAGGELKSPLPATCT